MFTIVHLQDRMNTARELIKARELVTKKGVTIAAIEADRFAALVQSSGKEPYEVELFASLDGTCGCVARHTSRDRKFCKHLAAAAVAWLDALGLPSAASAEPLVDEQIRAAIDSLSDGECRQLLTEVACMNTEIRSRLVTGSWTALSK